MSPAEFKALQHGDMVYIPVFGDHFKVESKRQDGTVIVSCTGQGNSRWYPHYSACQPAR